MPFEPSRYVDPGGELSPDMFLESDSALNTRLNGYYQKAAAKTANWAGYGNLEDARDVWVYTLAFRAILTRLTTTPASQSQPEYSRQITSEQIRVISQKLVGLEREFEAHKLAAEKATGEDLDTSSIRDGLITRG